MADWRITFWTDAGVLCVSTVRGVEISAADGDTLQFADEGRQVVTLYALDAIESLDRLDLASEGWDDDDDDDDDVCGGDPWDTNGDEDVLCLSPPYDTLG